METGGDQRMRRGTNGTRRSDAFNIEVIADRASRH